MKKIILLAALVVFGFTVSQSKNLSYTVNHFSNVFLEDTGWIKAANWTGMNKDKKSYYKINPKNLVIYTSVNTKSWAAVVGGTWVTKDGKWIKISTDKKLVWSADLGKTWTAVPDGTWQDADGDWCKFDAEWNLWVKKGEK